MGFNVFAIYVGTIENVKKDIYACVYLGGARAIYMYFDLLFACATGILGTNLFHVKRFALISQAVPWGSASVVFVS